MLLNIQKHCFELMSLNSLPRFLTESMKNIDTKEQKIRIWFVSIPTGLLLIALTVIAWTVPSFKRRHRWTVVIPAFACFLGLWQSYMALCVCHAALGTVSRKIKGYRGQALTSFLFCSRQNLVEKSQKWTTYASVRLIDISFSTSWFWQLSLRLDGLWWSISCRWIRSM